MVTPNKATVNFSKKGPIRQFLPHFCEISPFLAHLSSDFNHCMTRNVNEDMALGRKWTSQELAVEFTWYTGTLKCHRRVISKVNLILDLLRSH